MSESPAYPAELEIEPVARPIEAVIALPGSKSITNRALVLAALSSVRRPVSLHGVLRSEDTEVMVTALGALGYRVEPAWANAIIRVQRGEQPIIPASAAELFVTNSGTTMRFLTALVALGQGVYRLDGIPRMRERPIGDLLDALDQLGISAQSEASNGCPPVRIHGGTWRGGEVPIRGDLSSQFLSGLLLAAPFAPSDTTFVLSGDLVSRPYVEMTTRMMQQFGLSVSAPAPNCYLVPGRQATDGLPAGEYQIEPDASAASYFFASAALTGGRVKVPGLSHQGLQGDVRFVDLLEDMGCKVERAGGSITVEGAALHGIDVDMNDISDTVMTLAVVALFASGPTMIRNVAHIRHKETDRLAALATELRRLGADVDEHADGLTIRPRALHGARVETYNDHRMAMSLALAGLRVPGVIIQNPGCVAKTYPGYFEDLARVCC